MQVGATRAESTSGLRKTLVDVVTTLGLVGGLILVPTLGWQNLNLRQAQTQSRSAAVASLSETLDRLIALGGLVGTRLPDSIARRVSAVSLGDGAARAEGKLLVAFMPTVCGACLREGLESLRTLDASKRSQGERSIAVYVVVGEHGHLDREYALRLRQQGLLPYPTTFVPNQELVSGLFQHMGGEFAEEPLYLRLDSDLRILSAFQADQRRPDLLDQWLAATADL